MKWKSFLAVLSILLTGAQWSCAADDAAVQWSSATLGRSIGGTLKTPPTLAKAADGSSPLIIYLQNLAVPRLGTDADSDIVADLLKDGNFVLQLDYAHDPKSISPNLYADILKLRDEVGGKKKSFLTDVKIDVNHIFILCEGFRLKRDVQFAQDGKRVLAMDVMYPSHPKNPVPALIEYTCDNANRMGDFSILFCQDSLVEGGEAAGFAVAMADHPVPPPYKGIDDPMPEVIHRLKASVRTLRSLKDELNLNGNIGAIGFSRGGPMAGILATTNNRLDLEGDGSHRDVSSSVQAALIHGNRYDYTKVTADDPMYKRFEKVWGPREENPDKWTAHGPAKYLTKDAAPMFLDTSNAESKEYQFGLATFDQELTAAGVEHHYQVDPDGRGHKVSTDPKTLAAIYEFFAKHLQSN